MAQTFSTKIAAIASVVALSFGLAACGDDSADRAPKDEFLQGMRDIVAEQGYDEATVLGVAGLNQDQIDSYYQCVIDNSYDKLSEGYVNAVAEGNMYAEITDDDSDILNTAVKDCIAEMVK